MNGSSDRLFESGDFKLELSFCAGACGRLVTDDQGRATEVVSFGPAVLLPLPDGGIELRCLWCHACRPKRAGGANVARLG